MNKEKALRELERLLSKMKDQARTLDELETAQWHYMDLVDITSSGLFDINTLEKERKENPHFIRISVACEFLMMNNVQSSCRLNIIFRYSSVWHMYVVISGENYHV